MSIREWDKNFMKKTSLYDHDDDINTKKYIKIMNKKESINRITKELENIIRYEIKILADDNTFKDKYETLTEEIKYLLQEAISLVENYKSENLTYNTVESEGYLRAMLTVKNLIE